MKQAIIYCRFSERPDAKTSTSNEKQEERCKVYCDNKGYNILDIKQDKEVSGKLLDRPGLNSAIELLSPGMVLVVATSDRLARDVMVSLLIHQRIKAAECEIEFADGTPSHTSPESTLIANIFAAFAQFQREQFAARTKAGLKKKREEGIYLGRCPIGYKRKGKKLVVCDSEMAMVSSIINLSECGMTCNEITRHMNSFMPPFRGKRWSESTIRKILANK